MGAMTALMKDNVGIRGIVTATLSVLGWHTSQERVCWPFQYALSTRVARSLMELDPRKTLLSEAFDHIKRKAMVEAFHTNRVCANGLVSQALPWQRFHVRSDDCLPHEISHGEGGEQGDPLMPSLFALRQHAVLSQINAKRDAFRLTRRHYVLWRSRRVAEIFRQIQHTLHQPASRSTSAGPKCGVAQPSSHEHAHHLELRLGKAKELRRTDVGWYWESLSEDVFVKKWLADSDGVTFAVSHPNPKRTDALSAWLFFLMCAARRANHILGLDCRNHERPRRKMCGSNLSGSKRSGERELVVP